MYSTHNVGKSVMAERFIRNLIKFIRRWRQYQKYIYWKIRWDG